ncbi:hypothetical protein GMI69_07725 [Eggerthellaceae bacterium zg-887]|uniref:hypothetical protein n=1 Tax=Xiamenia xianingshaonis TaxID=2682776 RepID=UPI00140868CA|nr:hypothetical protein [Xiamenia xianingshaonis]NHM16543.1 hypothetical protein [Xiamenia xianingshaonis]
MKANFGDPLTESQMEACAVMAMRMMLEDFSAEKECPFPEALVRFAESRTYRTLFDYDTRLWAEGPDYLRGVWMREEADA